MAEKPKVAFYWCGSCGGCEEAVVDLAEDLLTVAKAVDIVLWPVAMDFKKKDIEALPDNAITASFINGTIRLSEHEEWVKLLRRKSQLVFAFGSCAHLGGIPGLANLSYRDEIFRWYYQEGPTVHNPSGAVPTPEFRQNGHAFDLPEFWDTARSLDQVIEVDYYIPGCPPPAPIVKDAVMKLLQGELPPKGSVLAGSRALCHECSLNETKPEKLLLKDLKRPHEVIPKPDECLLAQGLLCLGPVTRGGCGALCINAHMPCTGCFGPLDHIRDFGAKGLGALASILDYSDEEELERALENLPDPVGTFYKYSLPASLVRRRNMGGQS